MPIYKKKIVNLIQDISKCVRKNAGKIRDKRKTIIRKKTNLLANRKFMRKPMRNIVN